MDPRILAVPYDCGHRGERMGAGPDRLLELGLSRDLETAGCAVRVEHIEAREGFRTEIRTSFELYRSLSERVRAAVEAGAFPLTLAGNCGSALGTVSGARAGDIGIIWVDAHADFNTPETTPTGFSDGMVLATLTGLCWKRLAATIPGFQAVPGGHVVHVGGRDLDDGEEERMREAGVAVVGATTIARREVRPALDGPLTALGEHVREVYLHIDLDALDPRAVPANEYQPEGGLSISQLEEAVSFIGERFTISAAAITAYDPACDPENRAIHAVSRITERLLLAEHPLDRSQAVHGLARGIVTDVTGDAVLPTEWHDVRGRHLWKVRAYFDPASDHRGWYWEAYTRSKERHAGTASEHGGYPEHARWPTAEDALQEARSYLLRWESERPDFQFGHLRKRYGSHPGSPHPPRQARRLPTPRHRL